MKIILNVDRNVWPDRKKAGDTVDIENNLALRWVNAGIAHYSGIREMPTIQEIKVKFESLKQCKPTSIIIPVYNCLQYLKKCLDSIYKYTNNYEVIIVDNGSNDETKKYISELDQFDLKVITNSENKGFGYGNNQGIKVAKHDFLCFLNSDTIVTLDWLYKLQKAFKVNKDCGFTSPTTCYCGGIQCDQSLFKNRFSMSETEISVYSSSLKEEFIQTTVMGYCMLAKKGLFDKVGVFDYKRYGIGNSEEVDLEWRAEQFGYKNYWSKGAYVHHYGHMTFTENGISPWASLSKNRKIFEERKNDPNLFIENDVEIGVVKEVKIDTSNKISIIIPTYGQEDLIIKCIDNINKNCKLDKEIIIVDDGYEINDNADYNNCILINNEENNGFGSAVNTGIKQSKYDYIFLVNSDVFIKEGCIEEMIFALDNYADIVGAKLFYPDGRIQHAGVHYAVNHMFMHYLRGKSQGGDAPIYCPVTGALMGFKRNVIEKIGYFNEKFFLAYEDLDFCFRAMRANLKVLYWPKAKAVHLEGATRKTKSAEAVIKEQAGVDYFRTSYTEEELRQLCKPSPFR